MDPPELREELRRGGRRRWWTWVSPQLPREEEDKGSKPSASSDNNDNKANDKEPEEQKPKAPLVTTVVLKLKLHCAACIQKIERRIISKIEGLQTVAFDQDKDLVTVTSTMDAKVLVESLRERVSSPVEVVQPKNDKDGGGGSGSGSGSGGRKNKKGGGNGSKEEGDGGGGGKDGAKEMHGGAGEYFGRSRMEYNGIPPGYGYNYGFMYGNSLHAPRMFSDEYPNALT